MADGTSTPSREDLQKKVDELNKRVQDLEKEKTEAEDKLKKEQQKEEPNKATVNKLTGDLIGIDEKLRLAKETAEAAAKAAKAAGDLFKDIADALDKIIDSLTKLIKEIAELLKVLLIFPMLLQKLFDISISGSVVVQPLLNLPTTALASVTERDTVVLNERGIHTLGDLAEADLIELQRCGINVKRMSKLQAEARVAVRPFIDDFKFLIEEMELNLMEVARRAEADFIQPKQRIRAIRLDILSRTTVLNPGILDRLRVTDIIDIKVPQGFAQDCPRSVVSKLSS